MDVRRLTDPDVSGSLKFLCRCFKQAQWVVDILKRNGGFADLQHIVHNEPAGSLFAVNLTNFDIGNQFAVLINPPPTILAR